MLIVGLFIVVVVLVFGAVWFVMKPSRAEMAVESRLADIGQVPSEPSAAQPADILKRERYSDVPIVNLLLRRLALVPSLQQLLRQADSTWSVGRVVFATLLIFAAATWLSGLWLHSWAIGLLLGLGLSAVPCALLVVKRNARFRAFNTLLPEAIDLMSRALRAGHAITATIEMVAREIGDPVGIEFRRTFEEQNFGLPMREALLNLSKRVPVDDLKFLVTAILVQKETGGNLAEVLDKTVMVIRERARLLGQLRIYTAQGRMTGWVLGLLPFIVFGLMNIVNPGYARILIEDPTGRKAVWAGLTLMAIGVWVIRRVVNIRV